MDGLKLILHVSLVLFSLSSFVDKSNGFSSFQITRDVVRLSIARNTTSLAARPKKSSSSDFTTPIGASSQTSTPTITERMLNLTQNPNIAFIIDAENVRGKTNFELGHADLLDRLMVWASLREHALGRTIVVIDHGSKSTAHLLRHKKSYCNGICVAFAGPHKKADDVIARDTQWLLNPLSGTNTDHVVVITADQELSYRCRTANPQSAKAKKKAIKKTKKLRKKAIGKNNGRQDVCQDEEMVDLVKNSTTNNTSPLKVNIITSRRFLDDLDVALQEWLEKTEAQLATSSNDSTNSKAEYNSANDVPVPAPIGKWHNLIQIRTQMLSLESTLRNKCTPRKRQQLTEEMRKCKETWEKELSLIRGNNVEGSDDGSECSLAAMLSSSFATSLSLETNGEMTATLRNSTWDNLADEDQIALLLRWGKWRGSSKREETEDRVILAEMVRTKMELASVDVSIEHRGTENEDRNISLVELYAKYINNMPSS
ncbi:hypothetical protein HJC23_011457 [Cyclotella cryptica]|uniref:NYN domain-containing protein n=1 Tax=Cyclotella cryptica TaxID=29204 RepID=A0ABD3NUA5_9STRA|eukprot:CCRYP_019892-RA/>CCRYP_019892-RA protein AED:0.00 eAED:0.00 QI:64/-1/1/1/-1/1/1/19/484